MIDLGGEGLDLRHDPPLLLDGRKMDFVAKKSLRMYAAATVADPLGTCGNLVPDMRTPKNPT